VVPQSSIKVAFSDLLNNIQKLDTFLSTRLILSLVKNKNKYKDTYFYFFNKKGNFYFIKDLISVSLTTTNEISVDLFLTSY